MYDDVLRSNAADLAASELATAGVNVGVDIEPRTVMVHVPTAPTGTSPTLDVKIQESDDNATWRDYAAFPQINAAGQYFLSTKSNAPYRRAISTLGGTTPNFGKVLIAFVPAGRYTNW
ncbi:MAG TPA: hypothetical protein DDW19_01280 [Anaerolineaceae bacterium]|jgi:hypothetical protein|nr:hypothetical protein [Anaerolineaceae bacterium]